MKVTRFILIVLFIGIYYSSFCQSSSQVKIIPAKSWVKEIAFNKSAKPVSGQESSYYYQLIDEQENVPLQESFSHYAYKILSNDGLQQMSDLNVDFDPSYEQLFFHKLLIHRNGIAIDQLPKKIKTVQREQSMDRYLYDGSVTAVINLTDVRVGDVVEYAYTRKGYNPVYEGNFSRKISLNFSTAFEKLHQRIIIPTSLPLTFKYFNGEYTPEIQTANGQTTYTWALNKVNGLDYDNRTPGWYNPYSFVLLTSFKNWGEVAQWSVKRYQVSEKEKQVIANEVVPEFKSASDEEYALKVIRFVQDEIRYLGFESGLNSHKPHPPMDVYKQRFGDCKDKSLLLTTLLNAKGIEAYPMLLNTTSKDKLADQLPSTNAFDHCVVQATLNGKTFYVDPTINNQGGTLYNSYFPSYGKGLIVKSSTTDIIDLPEPALSTISEVQTFDLAAIDGEAMMTIVTTYKGAEAEGQRSYFANDNLASIQKAYINYYGNLHPDIETFDSIQTEDNREANIFIVREKYKIPKFWQPYKEPDQKLYCEFYSLTMESYFSVSKAARTTPYRLQYPLDHSNEMIINLPEEWTITPNAVSIDNDYYEYDYSTDYSDKRITILTRYRTKQSFIPVERFKEFIDDHAVMMSNLNYRLTYDKALVKAASNKWPGAILTITVLLCGVVVIFWLYRNYDPQPHYPATWGQPIGGWLVLVAFGLSITPIRLVFSFVTKDYLLDGAGWISCNRQTFKP